MPVAPTTALSDAASERKARLLALKKRKAGEVDDNDGDNRGKTKIALKQRNFDPVTRQPAQHAANGPIEDAAEGDEADAAQAKETVEKRMEGVAERILQEDESKRRQELDLLNIQPKRANWDLKRDMDKRMRKMDRKTQESYEYLFRQRLQAMKKGASAQTLPGGADILANMSAVDKQRRAGAEQDAARSDDDEDME